MFWVYGTDKCPNTKISINLLQQFNEKYRFVNLNEDEAASKFMSQYGYQHTPAIFKNGIFLGGYIELKEELLQEVNQGK